jgi:cysteine synthase
MTFDNVIQMIGNTPVLRLDNENSNLPPIYMKIEGVNPAGSIKDRAVLGMIDYATERGMIAPGATLIEPTSGNTGIALAMVGSKLGYKVKIVMPETMSSERRTLIRAFGAELVLTDGTLGMKGAIDRANSLVRETKGSMMLDQFSNKGNQLVHYRTTGEEIVKDFSQVDYFVCGVGTGGSISGIAKRLKEVYSGVRIIAVEPASSPVLSGGKPGAHKIQGIGAGFVPVNYDASLVDEVIAVSDDDAIKCTKLLLDKHGIFAGISTGANLYASSVISSKLPKDKKIVTISPDGGMKYVSMGIY